MHITTVGAYIIIDRRFLFVFGPNPQSGRLVILRVGGHRENGEAPWDCAAREALEETGLTISPLEPAETLIWQDGFAPFAREGAAPRPFLVLPRAGGADCNVMFLATAAGTPAPCNEVRGLLLLTPDEVLALNRRPTTLQEFLDAGGQAWMRSPYPPDMTLEPALQCRLLAVLLERGGLAHVLS